jgi:hypothetical protein
MRPSKLRLPDSTATTLRSSLVDAAATSSISGPEFPMHVVHPYPTSAEAELVEVRRQARASR